MSQCTDKKFEPYLHAYELDLLSNDERAEFEIHQLECDHCYEQVVQFTQAAHLLRYNEAVSHELDHLDRSTDDDEGTPSRAATDGKVWRRSSVVRVGSLIAAVVLVMVLKPWRLEIGPTDEAQAHGNRVVVMPFGNDDPGPDSIWNGATVAGLISSDLAQSDRLRVVSGEQLTEILDHLGYSDDVEVDSEVARRAAAEAGADWVVLVDLIRDTASLALVYHLVEMSTGEVVSTERVQGASNQSLYGIVDRLTAAVRTDMELTPEPREESDRPVEEITTSSLEAFRNYIKGLESNSRLYKHRAIVSFRKAVSIDSTFAMANFHLARLLPGDRRRELMDRALRHSDRVTRKDKLLIECEIAWLEGNREKAYALASGLQVLYPDDRYLALRSGVFAEALHGPEQAIDHYVRATQIDPLFREAWNMLAYAYQRIDASDLALEIVDRYASIAPDEPNPYHTRGEILLSMGRLDEGREAFERAAEIDPDFMPAAWSLATLALYRGDFDEATIRFYDYLAAHPFPSVELEAYGKAIVSTYRGKYLEALETLGANPAVQFSDFEAGLVWQSPARLKGLLHWERNELDDAIRQYEAILGSDAWIDSGFPEVILSEYVLLLMQAGDFDGAYEAVDSRIDNPVLARQPELFKALTEGFLSYGEGDWRSAIGHLRRAAELSRYRSARFLLAQALIRMGNGTEAARILEALASDYLARRHLLPVRDARLDKYLADAYYLSDQFNLALKHYRTFLTKHAEADSGIAAVDYARDRITEIETLN